MRIAIIEDNDSVARGIAYRLEDRGHATDVLHDGASADRFLRDDGNDLVILDINLPGLDGLEVLRRLRARGDQRPVLLLTARDATDERVAGLDAGADDYLTKPFAMDELEARLRALFRRREATLTSELQLGPLRFDVTHRLVYINDERQDLPRRELAALEVLLDQHGRVVSKAVLLDRLYGTGSDVHESVIEVHVSRLRKRLKPHGLEIQVQRGLGYRLIPADPAA